MERIKVIVKPENIENFAKILHNLGYKWNSGRSFLETQTVFSRNIISSYSLLSGKYVTQSTLILETDIPYQEFCERYLNLGEV